MNGRYDSEDLEDVHEGPPAADREISLGTGAMLGIFLALVLVCGAFFGFGYSMGHKTGLVVPPGAAVADPETAGPAASGEMKPLPGSSSVDAPEVVVKPSAGSGVRAGAVPRSAKVDTGADAPTTPIAGPPQGLKSGAKPYITAPAAPPSMAATIPAVRGPRRERGNFCPDFSGVAPGRCATADDGAEAAGVRGDRAALFAGPIVACTDGAVCDKERRGRDAATAERGWV